jgi:hypothetical protein
MIHQLIEQSLQRNITPHFEAIAKSKNETVESVAERFKLRNEVWVDCLLAVDHFIPGVNLCFELNG